ncbi:signal transduction histidine kinase [Crossiella equi]|uniref:histidine kinase n=1 Tax=Crossiella equi TaxID=130796 RepID=A0ABS5A7N4_9PSEU|nr:sensor histidine kinase [Crossiella equi]MBP2472605.1 signal transduction histidine kinase [Crossiella equi]
MAGLWERTWRGVLYHLIGMATALASVVLLPALFVCTLLVFTLPLLPSLVRVQRWVTDVDRRRCGARAGVAVPGRYRPLEGGIGAQVVTVLTDPGTRKDLGWLLVHAPVGMVLGVVGFGIPGSVVQNTVISAIWWLSPTGMDSSYNIHVHSWPTAGLSLLTAFGALLVAVFAGPWLADVHARTAVRLLTPAKASLVERVAELTATRAAALEAHGAELRRIERDLHDGTQNRLVAVVMHLGIVERALRRDPALALPSVLTAQNAAADALAELRDVVRSIYPPVLADRGLDGAVDALAARCTIPCEVTVTGLRRLPAAVEAAAYFVIAEALTNVAKHSGAQRCEVVLDVTGTTLTLTVLDDGHGGADAADGSGLTGISRRVAAFDGTTELFSPRGGPTRLTVTLPTGT